MGAVLQKLKGEEGGGDAAVKRQAEGFANPMYRMLDLGVGTVIEEVRRSGPGDLLTSPYISNT